MESAACLGHAGTVWSTDLRDEPGTYISDRTLGLRIEQRAPSSCDLVVCRPTLGKRAALASRGRLFSLVCPVVCCSEPRAVGSGLVKMRKERPHPDERQAHKVGEQQGGHRGSAVDQPVEQAVAWPKKICLYVEPESQYANKTLRQHHDQTHIHKSPRHRDYERNDQEASCKR